MDPGAGHRYAGRPHALRGAATHLVDIRAARHGDNGHAHAGHVEVLDRDDEVGVGELVDPALGAHGIQGRADEGCRARLVVLNANHDTSAGGGGEAGTRLAEIHHRVVERSTDGLELQHVGLVCGRDGAPEDRFQSDAHPRIDHEFLLVFFNRVDTRYLKTCPKLATSDVNPSVHRGCPPSAQSLPQEKTDLVWRKSSVLVSSKGRARYRTWSCAGPSGLTCTRARR